MKDPLHTQPTPYDILGIDRSAGPADIDQAFRAGLAKGVNPSKLTGAKKTLERPVDRAMLDLFLYDPEVLARLRPDPGADPGCLTLDARGATAEDWEAQLRRSFPDYGIAHALAVLWYWWALHASDRLATGGAAGAEGSPSFDVLWESAIAYWAMVVSSDGFWDKHVSVAKEVIPEVRRALSERLPGDLQRLAQQHRDAGQEELADQYRRLELMLATEVKTAKALAGAGYGTSAGPLWCGALMLGRLSLLDSIREQVSADFAASPRDETLQSLTRALSPHFRIAALIERKEPHAALEAIGGLSAGEKRSKEVKELKARALLLKGRQEESLGKIREALRSWKEASACGPPVELAGKIREAASEVALAAATALHSQDRKEAIAILDLAVSFAATEKLNRTLAELLTERGIETVVKAQKEFEKNPSTEGAAKLTKAIEKGLKDLDRGAELGSARAREQANVARSLLGLSGGMSPEARSLLEEANQAASRKDLNISIRKLRSALEKVSKGSEAHTQISKMLSAALSGHAVSVVNETMERAQLIGQQEVAARLQEALKELTEAGSLDPTNEQARNNLASLLELMTKLGVPLVPGGAPIGGSVSAKARAQNRDGALPFVAGIALLLAAVLGFLSLPNQSIGFLRGISGWVRAVSEASPTGPALLWLGYAFGGLGILTLLSIPFHTGPASWLVGGVADRKWRGKNPILKLLEVAQYAFLVLFAGSVMIHGPPPGSVEPPLQREPASAEEATPGQPAVSEAAPSSTTTTEAPTAAAAAPDAEVRASEPAPSEAPALDVSDVSWMATDPIPPETVTELLGAVTNLAEEEREPALARLDSAGAGAGESVQATLALLRSASAEESGDYDAARTRYHQLLTIAGGGRYGATASLRLEVLDARDEDALEKALKERAEGPGDTIWARMNEGWVHTSAQRAALLGLMDVRSDRLTVRFYRFLAEHSFTEPHAAYLRIYGYILILWVLVQLPLLGRMTELFRAAPRLRPHVARLQQEFKGDQATLAKKLPQLYALHGVNPAWGCLHGLIDIAFVVLFYFTFRAYAPQLVLDDANFYGMADLLHRDPRVLGLWGFMGFLYTTTRPNVTGPGAGAVAFRAVLGVAIVCAVAWWLHWPAWLLIFWVLLWVWSICFRALAVFLSKRRA